MRKQRPRPRHTALEKIWGQATLDRRGIKLVVGAVAVIALVLLTLIIRTSLPVKLTNTDRAMLRQYDAIRVALSQDDLESAQKVADTLASSYKERRRVLAGALALSKANSLEAARDAFSAMSTEAVRMVRGHKEYYVVGCSMNECPAPCQNCQMFRFSDWVQTDPTIANPFMGKASPHCGVIKL